MCETSLLLIVLPTATFEIFAVAWQGIDYRLSEDDMIMSKHVTM
jgi:hypothetical protein